MRVLVLGGYGLIGGAITTAAVAAGHAVSGLGRSIEAAAARWPTVQWISRDLRSMAAGADWQALIADIDVVINAAGVLQDGPADDVAAVQFVAMRALFEACEAQGGIRIVQISAAGADASTSTAFMTTKAEADAALTLSSLDWVILRPGLVFGPAAYGGTAMLRAMASIPLVLPVGFGRARIQTVALDDVAKAALMAAEGRVPMRRAYDLVEDEPHQLPTLLMALRGWLGLKPAPVIEVPDSLIRLVFRAGDLVGRLGWRPPVRTTALRQIEASVTGDPAPWREATGMRLKDFAATLAATPASVQERWFARMWLMKPVVIGTLVLFWLASGIVGLLKVDAAATVLTTRGMSQGFAVGAVVAGAFIDIVLGIGAAFRRFMKPAMLGMIATTLGYLCAGTLLAPDLWADPLGPYVKTLPAMVLALVALAVADDR